MKPASKFTHKGRIDSIELTFGSAGHQWTTIDGVRYATWFDWGTKRSHPLREGSVVEFRPYRGKLFANMGGEIDCATIGDVLEPA